jgi:hypothetical protein
MENLIKFDADVSNRIITIRNQAVLLDADVAKLYGVQTMRINEAVKNNPKKFPEGYIFELSKQEWHSLRASIIANISKSANSGRLIETFDKMSTNNRESERLKSHVLPKAFTEKGLYMLATILKSERATEATISIVEAFTKIRELSRNIAMLSSAEPEIINPEIIESTGSLVNDLLFSHFPTTLAKTSLELNFGLVKLKREISNEKSGHQNELEELKKMIEKISKKLEI